MKASIAIVREPRGRVYDLLLTFLAKHAASFSLVWQHHPRAEPSVAEIERRLSPYLIRREMQTEWPGTRRLLPSGGELVQHFAVSPESVAILREIDALYAWLMPAAPEDLAFYRHDGGVLLASCAHEQFSWLDGDAVSADEVGMAVQGIRLGGVPRRARR